MQYKKRHMTYDKTQGFGMLEIVIVSGLIAMTFAVLTQAEALALRLLKTDREKLEATLLAGEALDAMRAIRDESWTAGIVTLATNGTLYYPIFENGKWALTTTAPPLIDGAYVRYVLVTDVVRDAQDRIVSSGTLDSGTKRVIARVLWGNGKVAELTSYLTNFQASLGSKAESVAVSYDSAAEESNLANFPSGDGSGDPLQSFTAPSSAIAVSRIDLLLRRDPATIPSDAYAELRASPTGAVLGISHQVYARSITTGAPSWVTFRFQKPVSLAATSVYFIRLRSVPNSNTNGSGGAGLLYWRYGQSGSSPYAGGQARRYVGHLSDLNYAGEVLSQYDFGFKAYKVE